jgi:hypothetical protein
MKLGKKNDRTDNGKWTRIYASLWRDMKIAGLSDKAFILFPYLFSCDHRTRIGVFYLPLPFIMGDLPMFQTVEQTSDVINELSVKGFLQYDYEHELIYLPKFIKRNPLKNASHAKSALNEIATLLNSYRGHPFWADLIQYIPDDPYLSELQDAIKGASKENELESERHNATHNVGHNVGHNARHKKKGEVRNSKKDSTPKKDKAKEKAREASDRVLAHWNDKNIYNHSKGTQVWQEIHHEVGRALTWTTEEKILFGIDMYALVLARSDFFDTKWSLAEFLHQKNGLRKFLEDPQRLLVNYIGKDIITEICPQCLGPVEERTGKEGGKEGTYYVCYKCRKRYWPEDEV